MTWQDVGYTAGVGNVGRWSLFAITLWSCLSCHAMGTELAEPGSVFSQHCAPCHGSDGRARTPVARKLRVKDLSMSTLPEVEIRRQITEGSLDQRGKPLMPAFKQKLTSEEIDALVAQVKAFRK